MNANAKRSQKKNKPPRRPRQRRKGGAKRTQKQQVNRTMQVGRNLSNCAVRYLASLRDPFDNMDIPCIPDPIALDTRKVKVFAKGVFATSSSTSVGWICFNPFRAQRTSVTASLTSIRHTDATFTGSAINIDSTTIGVVSTNTNAEYTDSQTGAVSYRLISAGLRVRYAGTELNRGGSIQMLEEPAHYTLHNHNSANFGAYDSARRFPMTDDQWACVTYTPRYPQEFAFADIEREPDNKAFDMIQITNSSQTNTGCAWCLGALITGAASPNNFIYECFAQYEYIGDAVRGKTPSEADPVGLAAVLNATRLQAPFLSSSSGIGTRVLLSEASRNLKMQSKPGLN